TDWILVLAGELSREFRHPSLEELAVRRVPTTLLGVQPPECPIKGVLTEGPIVAGAGRGGRARVAEVLLGAIPARAPVAATAAEMPVPIGKRRGTAGSARSVVGAGKRWWRVTLNVSSLLTLSAAGGVSAGASYAHDSPPRAGWCAGPL